MSPHPAFGKCIECGRTRIVAQQASLKGFCRDCWEKLLKSEQLDISIESRSPLIPVPAVIPPRSMATVRQ